MNTKGIGLGLLIAKQIVKQFEGKISFKSQIGVGTTFEFTFKLSKEDDLNQGRVEKMQDVISVNSKDLEFRWNPRKFRNTNEFNLLDKPYNNN